MTVEIEIKQKGHKKTSVNWDAGVEEAIEELSVTPGLVTHNFLYTPFSSEFVRREKLIPDGKGGRKIKKEKESPEIRLLFQGEINDENIKVKHRNLTLRIRWSQTRKP